MVCEQENPTILAWAHYLFLQFTRTMQWRFCCVSWTELRRVSYIFTNATETVICCWIRNEGFFPHLALFGGVCEWTNVQWELAKRCWCWYKMYPRKHIYYYDKFAECGLLRLAHLHSVTQTTWKFHLYIFGNWLLTITNNKYLALIHAFCPCTASSTNNMTMHDGDGGGRAQNQKKNCQRILFSSGCCCFEISILCFIPIRNSFVAERFFPSTSRHLNILACTHRTHHYCFHTFLRSLEFVLALW